MFICSRCYIYSVPFELKFVIQKHIMITKILIEDIIVYAYTAVLLGSPLDSIVITFWYS